METDTNEAAPITLPNGDYAIVEILGKRTLIGRVTEIERFGQKLMSIEPIFASQLQEPVLIGGGSIYMFTPCSAEVALKRQPKEVWQLPPAVAAVIPPAMLPAPSSPSYSFEDDDDDDDDGMPF